MRAPFFRPFLTLAPALALFLVMALCLPAPALADTPNVRGQELYPHGK